MTATSPEETSSQVPEQPIFATWVDDLDRTLEDLDSNNLSNGAPDHRIGFMETPEANLQDTETFDHSVPQAPQPLSNATALEKLITPNMLFIARLMGYGLLLMGFVDLLYILIPPQLTNPVWEYQAIGDMVKLVPVPILALLLIFSGEKALRRKLELKLLPVLSWLTLGISIVFFLLLPLIITDSFKIDRFNKTQINTEIRQQKQKLDATQKQVQNMNGDQLKYFIPTPDKLGSLGSLPDSPAQAKSSISENLERAKVKADAQAAEARKNVTANLVKNTFKLFTEALISGVIFLMFWSRTDWARQRSARRSTQSARAANSTPTPKATVGKSKKRRR